MAYTTIKKPSDYFNTNLYTGNNTETSHTVGFQPDFTWLKVRNAVGSHYLFDSVRLATKYLQANTTAAEGIDANTLKSFDANGYTVGTSNSVNSNNETMVGWNWKAGGTAVSNTDGTISSTVSANTTSGFSIVSYSGTGSAGTIGHGLGVAPSMIIVKVRTGRTASWLVYHKGIASDAQTDFIKLESTDAAADEATIWNDAAPTSSVFSVGTEDTVSGSGNTFIAYCFAEKKGFSKFGSYTGNGSTDGTFIYTGFKPAFTLIKASSIIDQWSIFDATRNPFNEVDNNIRVTDAAEVDQVAKEVDYLSNGIKLRTASGEWNSSGTSYIYMAFAEEPLVGDNPATAR